MARTAWEELVDIDRPIADLFRSYAGPWAMRPWLGLAAGRPFMPTTDVLTHNGDLLVRVDLPGIDPAKDVSVTYEEGELTIKGERKQEKEVKEEGYYRKERTYGSFERHIPLPTGVKETDIKAEYKDGVLEITVPGAARTTPKPKQIAVKATKPAKA